MKQSNQVIIHQKSNKLQIIMKEPENHTLSKLKEIIKTYNLVGNFLLFSAIVSANFAIYIAYFDINSLSIIDSTTIIKHILSIVMVYIIIHASVTITLLLFKNLVRQCKHLHTSLFSIEIPRIIRVNLYNFLDSLFLSLTIKILLFSYFYIGGTGSIIITISFVTYLLLILYFKHAFDREESITIEKTKEDSNKTRVIEDFPIYLKIPPYEHRSLIYGVIDNLSSLIERMTKDSKNSLIEGKYFKFLSSQSGSLLLFLAIALGIGRGVYVENNMHVYINNKPKPEILYMTTTAGVGLYSINKKESFFISWA